MFIRVPGTIMTFIFLCMIEWKNRVITRNPQHKYHFGPMLVDPTLAGIFCAHFPKSAHEKTTLPGPFPFVDAFEPPWVPTHVQSAHFPYKPTLMVEHEKTKNAHEKKILAHLQWCRFFSILCVGFKCRYFARVHYLFICVGSFRTPTLLLFLCQ